MSEDRFLNFEIALAQAKKGARLRRKGWNGNGMLLMVQFPDKNSKMTHPYFYMTIPGCTEGERKLPWQPAQVDLFANDWIVETTGGDV